MAEIAQTPAVDPHGFGSIRFRVGAILSLLVAFITLAPIAVFNKYVFLESNLVILLGLFIIAAMMLSWGSVPRGIFFPSVALSFLLLISYAWMRLDDPGALDLLSVMTNGDLSGSSVVVDLTIYYCLFVTAALLYYRKPHLSIFLWFLIVGYVLAFVLRNSIDIGELQSGYNLSPGFVLVSMLPFVFLRRTGDRKEPKLVPYALLIFSMLWLALIGARTAVASLLIFAGCLYAWPLIARNRFNFYLSFWGMWILIAVLTVVYLTYVVYTGAGLVEDSDVGIFKKGLGTRVDIWAHLAYLISQQPWFGYGTDHATHTVPPLQFMNFSFHRDDLSAHSVYFEVLYRLGVVGLAGYILVLFNVWRLFWQGRQLWEVRVACAFIICLIFFNATGEFLMFSTMRLRSGFGWILLGIAAGACLRARNRQLWSTAIR